MSTAITLQSVTSQTDAYALPPVPKPKELKLEALRKKLGGWMKTEDAFLNKLKVPITRDSERDWSVTDVWAGEATGIVLIQRALSGAAADAPAGSAATPTGGTGAPAGVGGAATGVAAAPAQAKITIKSVADATDQFALPATANQQMLDALRKTLGQWLLENDRFLDRGKLDVPPEREAACPAEDVVVENAILIRRERQTIEIKLQRDDSEIDSTLRFAPGANLAEVRKQYQARGLMGSDDAFVESDGREQIPIVDERTRSLQSAIKNKTLRITSTANWG